MTRNNVNEAILEHYGRKGDLIPFDSYDDLIFQFNCSTGKRYVLKIYDEAHDIEGLKMQMEVMSILDAALPNVEIPVALTTLTKDTMPVFKGRHMTLHPFVSGQLMGDVNPVLPTTRKSLGKVLGQFQSVLFGLRIHGDVFESEWDNAQADWLEEKMDIFNDDELPAAKRIFECYKKEKESIADLRKGIIHNDANEYNLFVKFNKENRYEVSGVIDFGDTIFSSTVNDVAIGCAYAMMGLNEPLEAACDVIRGYHEVFPFEEEEIRLLFTLIKLRLLISLTHSTLKARNNPDNIYNQLHNQPTKDLISRLDLVNEDFAHYMFRSACGWNPSPQTETLVRWLSNQQFFPLMGKELLATNSEVLDLSITSTLIGSLEKSADTEKFTQQVFAYLSGIEKEYGVGRYDEIRLLYSAASFANQTNNGPSWRTLHLGIDIFAPAGHPLYAPLDGEVIISANNNLPKDYGHVVVLKHSTPAGQCFYSLYGHLSSASLKQSKIGNKIKSGEIFAWVGEPHENGDWVPHVHFQLITDLIGEDNNFPGVADPRHRDLWLSLCPDPNLILRLETCASNPFEIVNTEDLRFRRAKHLPKNLSLSFGNKPLTILRAQGVYLFDQHAQTYLDTVNNVAHVGHENPNVVAAGQNQMAILNTNTRYLHPAILDFSESLLAKLPESFEVVFFCNSGSEANDLALRLARNYTQMERIVVLEQGYHGHTQRCIEASSYKFDNQGGQGKSKSIIKLPIPDCYRGRYATHDAHRYIEDVKKKISDELNGGKLAGLISEAILSCAGQIVPPTNYYKELYKIIRSHGGVCIADEVQTGFGRVGSHFWAFELHGVTPDIVTMGKPMGNGHPLAAVVTTRAVAESFDNGMEYFNTFGGNPVSCTIGQAVLNQIHENNLQLNAQNVGRHLKSELQILQERFECIGDVRGHGLFLGIEIVDDPIQRIPSKSKADYIVLRMKDLNIQMSTDGPDHNVLKIKPPLVFSTENADMLTSALAKILEEDFMQTRL